MRKMNLIDKVIYCLYRYYKKDLFQAKMQFSLYLILFLFPISFFIDKLLGSDVFTLSDRLNYFSIMIYVAIPVFLIVQILTIKKNEIEKITDEEGEILRKDGKRYIIFFLLIVLVLWAARIFLFLRYKY